MTTAEKCNPLQGKLITVSSNGSEKQILKEVLGNGRISYSLFESECEIDEQIIPCYGIEISSSLFDKNERERISGITTKLDVAKELFNLLLENMVTPISFRDITEDFIIAKSM